MEPPNPLVVQQAAAKLRDGGIVAFPTETVYGLGADALSAAAVRRVFELKSRPVHNPLIVHVTGDAMARRVVREWPDDAQLLARAFWPGPLSIVLHAAAIVPSEVVGGPRDSAATVAVRCPDHPVALALLFAFGAPLVGPSANRSGGVSPTTAEHVRSEFSDGEVMVLDGGPCITGIESTVVFLGEESTERDAGARVLRPGIVSAEQISAVLGRTVAGPADGHHDRPLRSPGLLESHYAPRTPARIVVACEAARIAAEEPRAALLAFSLPPSAPAIATMIQMPRTADLYAARLYAALREADSLNAAFIAVETPPTQGAVWSAIWDRLRRATTPRR
ncbi:MAG: threonylcarbamoyl-AMP synthase [Phycisphaerales bacterium]|nr:threonylcarbamoyl-AMP synthase [Phycisphaerales bacterium]